MKKMIKTHVPFFILLMLFLLPCSLSPQTLFDSLDYFNTYYFHKADGWTNGLPFNCTWRAECVTFSSGIMSLKLDSDSGNLPYKSGEYRTNINYSYGLYEVRMKTVRVMGATSNFFVYTGPSEGNPWDEVDIEFIWRNPDGSLSQNGILQTNYFTNGVGGHETKFSLDFDSSADFHVYAFEWAPDYIKWYVDGSLIHIEDGSRGALPVTPGKIMMNFWPGIGLDNWLGPFNGPVPLYAQYDWVRFTPASDPTPGPTATPTSNITPTPVSTVTADKGDVNSSGTVDIIDALLVAQYYVDLNPQGFNVNTGDTNCNGTVDIVDALLISQYYVGLIKKFC